MRAGSQHADGGEVQDERCHQRDDGARPPIGRLSTPGERRRARDYPEQAAARDRAAFPKLSRACQSPQAEHHARKQRRVDREQDARDDPQVAEVGQDVRIGILPYTDHGYEGVFNRILMARKPSPWSARFAEPVDERVKRFTASVGFDRRLAKYDIQARAPMPACWRLRASARRDLAAIQRGLEHRAG